MSLCQKPVLAVLISLVISCTFPTVVEAQALPKAHPKKKFINPTGTYILKGKQKGNET